MSPCHVASLHHAAMSSICVDSTLRRSGDGAAERRVCAHAGQSVWPTEAGTRRSTSAHTHTHTHTQAHPACAQTCRHACTHVRTHARTHTCARAHTDPRSGPHARSAVPPAFRLICGLVLLRVGAAPSATQPRHTRVRERVRPDPAARHQHARPHAVVRHFSPAGLRCPSPRSPRGQTHSRARDALSAVAHGGEVF